jgi:hypothetical protein
MKKFSQYLDQNGLNEWISRREVGETPLVEAKLSRVFQYVEDDKKDFGIVSAFRGENSREENKKLHDDLKKRVRDMGYGYIEMKGGYQEEGGVVEELSLLIPNIKKEEIVKLGRHYKQHSVMYKNDQDFYYIGTNESAGIGKVLMRFKKGEGQDNLELAKHKVVQFFSQLRKGPHAGKKFVFNVKDEPQQQGGESEKSGESAAAAHKHRPGDVWKTSSGLFGAMDNEGNYEYFEDKESAMRYAKKHKAGYRIQEREEWGFAKAAYLRRGEEPKWITIFEDLDNENS